MLVIFVYIQVKKEMLCSRFDTPSFCRFDHQEARGAQEPCAISNGSLAGS